MARASVHWNLHHQIYSIKIGSDPVFHAKQVVLSDCTFHIDARLRAAFEAKPSRRTVHALVRGTLVSTEPRTVTDAVRIRCNPFKFCTFVRAHDETPVKTAALVVLHADRTIEAIGVI